jgi:LysM repeat protein
MKKILLLLLIAPIFSWAQKTHKVGPKESLFSIGRLYNVHPRELAEFNNISFDAGVKIDQVLKIPTDKKMAPLGEAPAKNATPAKETETKKVAPASEKTSTQLKTKETVQAPIYHKVQKKETLYHISSLYTGATIENIKKWNNITTDGVQEGMNLIVGYKNEKENTVDKKAVVASTTAAPVKEVKESTPVVVEKVVEKTTIQKSTSPEKKEVVEKEIINTNESSAGGFFRNLFNTQTKDKSQLNNESGTAAVFKSTSGWDDSKYYCLHNSAPAGTIIKIINPKNQNFVYEKVLDVIPDLKQNNGILIRMSNAAAEKIGITSSDSFEVSLNY